MFGRQAEETLHYFTQRGRLEGKGGTLEEDLSIIGRRKQQGQGNRVTFLANFTENTAGVTV